jgi:hypothetical protein
MKRVGISVVVVVLIGFLSGPAGAAQDLVEAISRDCKGEIARYCGTISPGRSRMLACLYAQNEKLTSDCGFALMDAMSELDRSIANLALVVKGCRADLKAYCPKVRPGEHRLMDCLSGNKDKVSAGCKEALKSGGLNEF